MDIRRSKTQSNIMTEGSPFRALLLYSLPLIAGNFMQQLYNTVDSLIVGRYVGDAALAAVGGSGQIINFLLSFMWGASAGAGIVIAQYFGAKDRKRLERACHTTVLLAVVAGLLIMALGLIFSKSALIWMQTPPDMLEEAMIYLQVFFIGMVFNAVYNMIAGILNAVGRSELSLLFLVISSVTNITLDIALVAGLRMGVMGAAVATDVSQAVSAVLAVGFLMKTKESYGISLRKIRWDSVMAKRILRIGFPTAIQQAVICFSNVLIQSGVNAYGTLAASGFTAYIKVDGFNILPVMSFSLAATTYVGQNAGAGRWDRVKRGTVTVLLMSVVYTVIMGAVMIIFRYPIISFFTSNATALRSGVLCVWALAPCYAFLAVIHSLAGAVRGTGHTVPPMVIILINLCGLRILWIRFIAPLFHSIMGVYLTYSVSIFMCALMMVLYTWKGNWKDRTAVK